MADINTIDDEFQGPEYMEVIYPKKKEDKPKHAGGRPPLFKTPEELEAKWNEYKQHCSTTGEWLEKTGFLEYINVYSHMIMEYKKKQEFSTILEKIDNQCKRDLLQRGLKNEYNAQIVKLIASADYGMAEKTDNTNKNENHNVSESYSDFKARLDEERQKAIDEKTNAS